MRLRKFLGAAAAATFVAVATWAPPASADDAPEISIDSPGGGDVLDGPVVTVSGSATMHTVVGLLDYNTVTRVTVRLTSPVHPGPLPQCDPCSDEGFSVPFSWTTPELAYNGPYTAVVTASGRENPVDLNGSEQASASRAFAVAVAPAAPGGVQAVVNPDRTVTVSWAPNSEPDMIGYQVQRKDPGSSDFVVAGGLVSHPAASLVDPVPGQGGGGAYAYRVFAIRPGASGGTDDAIASGGADTGAQVPGPGGGPPVPTPGIVPGAPGSPGAPPAAGAPIDLAGFVAGGSPPQASLPGLPGGLAMLPDGTYDPSLPYGAGGARNGGGSGRGSAAIVSASAGSNGRALLVPLAAGLLLGVTAFHLRMLSRRLALETPAAG